MCGSTYPFSVIPPEDGQVIRPKHILKYVYTYNKSRYSGVDVVIFIV